MEARKRSNTVLLTLVGLPLGAMALADMIPAGHQMRRNLYPDRAACERDYSPQQCQQNTGSSSGGGHGGSGYHGPYYYADRTAQAARSDPGVGRTGQVARSETTVRGGFGAFGRAMHAVG